MIAGTRNALGANYQVTDLGTLGGSYSCAYGINDAGQVVGEADNALGFTHAFMYDGTMHNLGGLNGDPDPGRVVTGGSVDLRYGYLSCAYGISDSGQIIGRYMPVAGDVMTYEYGFLYDSGMNYFSISPDALDIEPCGISRSGEIVGMKKLKTGLATHSTTTARYTPLVRMASSAGDK